MEKFSKRMKENREKVLGWIDYELKDQEAMQDTINLDHPEAEIDCYNMHGNNIQMLCVIRSIVEDFYKDK